jgi:hypothetical protein
MFSLLGTTASAIVLFCLANSSAASFLPNHHFPIEGELLCTPASGGKRLPVNAYIEVWEADTSEFFDRDLLVNMGWEFKNFFRQKSSQLYRFSVKKIIQECHFLTKNNPGMPFSEKKLSRNAIFQQKITRVYHV